MLRATAAMMMRWWAIPLIVPLCAGCGVVIPLRLTGSAGGAFGRVVVQDSSGGRTSKSSTVDVAARIGAPIGVVNWLDVEAGYSYRYHTVSRVGAARDIGGLDQHGPFVGLGFRAWTSDPRVYEEGDITWWMLDVRVSTDLVLGDVGNGIEYGFGQTVSAGLEWVLLPEGKDARGTELADEGKREQQTARSLPIGIGVAVIGGHNRVYGEDYWTVGVGLTFRMATGLIPKVEGRLPIPIPFPLPISGGDVHKAPSDDGE